MGTGLLFAVATFFCAVSWMVAVAANHAFRNYDRLPGLFSLTGKAARLDSRAVALFIAPGLLTLIFVFVIAIDFVIPADGYGEALLVIAGTGVAMVISQIIALRSTRRWADTQN